MGRILGVYLSPHPPIIEKRSGEGQKVPKEP